MKNIKLWDKIVYDWYTNKYFILVETIDDFLTEEWSVITLINWIYSINWPLRKPNKFELEVADFKGIEKNEIKDFTKEKK